MKLNAQGIKKGSELQAYPGLRLAEESPVPDKAALPALFLLLTVKPSQNLNAAPDILHQHKEAERCVMRFSAIAQPTCSHTSPLVLRFT